MAKVKFNQLSRGQPLTPAMVWDNLDQAATALSGNIAQEQRAEGRSTFSVALQRVRFSDAIWNNYQLASDPTVSVSTTANLRPEAFIFALPPLQEFWDDQHIDGIDTPNIILESLAVSFDTMNQEKPTVLDTSKPSAAAAEEFNRALTVNVELYKDYYSPIQPGQIIAKAGMPLSSFNLSNETMTHKPNPTVSAYVGAVVGAYDIIKVTVTSPIEIDYATIGALAAGKATGVDSLHIHATFSAPVVQRDNAAYSVLPQNAPLHDCARSPQANVLTRPVQGTAIQAEDATHTTFDGVQDGFSQLDRQVRQKLAGGLTRWSEVRPNTESLLEDQGYFCWMVPLFNVAEDEGIVSRLGVIGANNYNSVTGYRRYNADRSKIGLMDKAVIPIVAPGTIHHVGLFWDKCYVNPANQELHMDFGCAIGAKVRAEVAQYTQVSRVSAKDITYTNSNYYINHFWAPIAYSTHATAPPLGEGFVTQGRPFYFGREIDYTGGVIRRNVADAATPGNAEAAPKTNGLEQFLEVRCNINLWDVVASAYIDMSGGAGQQPLVVGNGAGIMVCIYGKMALVE